MYYRPRWERILFLAAIFNVIAVFVVTANWFEDTPEVEEEPELQEISWVEAPASESATVPQPEIQTFPEINLPNIELPKIEVPPLPEPAPVEKPVESPKEVAQEVEKPAETNSAEPAPPQPEMHGVLKVIVKVYPKDLIDQLIASGVIKERTAISSGKIVLAVTIGVDGKVKKAEIRRGGGNDERGNIINLLSEAAAGGWIFEPYLDENGKPQEMKTQIEFKPEDF